MACISHAVAPYKPCAYYSSISTTPEPLKKLLLFTLPFLKLQILMIEQPQLDTKLQPNQLEPTIPNQTPAIVN